MLDIKDYREQELKHYVIANSILIILSTGAYPLFVSFASELSSQVSDNTFVSIIGLMSDIISMGLLSSLVYVYVFVLDSVISGEQKFRICYLFHWQKPGFTIFEKIANGETDGRFGKEDAIVKYAKIYETLKNTEECKKGAYQNKEWYSIYNRYRNHKMIVGANRDYLLCRDLCIATVAMLVICIFVRVLIGISFDCRIYIFLIIEAIITDAAMWAKGRSLAKNVIVLDIHETNNE